MRKQNAPVKVRDIVAEFGYTPGAARHIMQRLGEKGCIVGTGYGNARTYLPTKVKPEDTRGLALGSIASAMRCLNPGKWGQGKRGRAPKRFRYGTELERVWR